MIWEENEFIEINRNLPNEIEDIEWQVTGDTQNKNENLRSKDIIIGNIKMKRKTTNEFIAEATAFHKGKYDYAASNYKGCDTKIEIGCPQHGSFWQTPYAHVNQHQGCPSCAGIKKLTTEEFIIRANKIHHNKYNYSNVQYFNSFHKVKIICPIHGEFYQTPHEHLRAECYNCGQEKRAKSKTINTQTFIERARRIHGNAYNYDDTHYIHNRKKVNIRCLSHGIFQQRPMDHIHQKQGCPTCRTSKGERQIIKILEENNIPYEYEKIFSDCRNPNTNRNLKFDFFIPHKKLLIEFDGEQHFRPVVTKKYSITAATVKSTQMRDNINYPSPKGDGFARV